MTFSRTSILSERQGTRFPNNGLFKAPSPIRESTSRQKQSQNSFSVQLDLFCIRLLVEANPDALEIKWARCCFRCNSLSNGTSQVPRVLHRYYGIIASNIMDSESMIYMQCRTKTSTILPIQPHSFNSIRQDFPLRCLGSRWT